MSQPTSNSNEKSAPSKVASLTPRIDRALRRDRGRFQAMLRRGRFDPRRLEADLETSITLRQQRLALQVPLRYPADLPVTAHREALLEAIRNHPVIVVCGQTGSGKSTQLPKLCLELGLGREGMIGHTQPRRIAARSIAMRVREEIEAAAPGMGARVGYQVRFGDTTDPLSAIKLMTDGILLQEIRRDRLLQAYDVIIVDEAHERSLNIDLLLGHLRTILPRRPDLKVIVTSATLDSARFAAYFAHPDGTPAPVLEVEGRTYPVEIRYLPPQETEEDAGPGSSSGRVEGSPLQRSVIQALDSLRAQWPVGPGDVLVFLPTEREIHGLRRGIEGYLQHHGGRDRFDLLPLYARLSPAEQQRVFAPSGHRTRIVLATNVAESSLTVPGIRYVIDTGTARISRYAARSGIQRLPIEPIAQANAQQRAGRCGRLGPGVCYRLYAEEDFASREAFTQPEIQRSGLSGVILQMMAMGFETIERFPFLDPPKPAMIRAGRQTLFELGAISAEGQLTDIGRQLARLPVDPRVGRIILAGAAEKCLAEILIIAAALEGQDPRLQPLERQQAARTAHQRYDDPEGDFIALLKLWDFYHALKSTHSRSALRRACETHFLSEARFREWTELHRQLKDLARTAGLEAAPRQDAAPALHRALLTGLLARVAMRVDRQPGEKDKPPYLDTAGQGFHLWPGSSLQRKQAAEAAAPAPGEKPPERTSRPKGPRWLVAAATLETSQRYLMTAGRIDPAWIEPLAGHLVRRTVSHPRWDRGQGRVIADEKVALGALVLVPRRPIDFGHHDLPAARTLFIQQALIEGDADIAAPFFAHNARLLEAARQLEARTRQTGLAISDEERFAWYDHHLPPEVCSVPTLSRYLKSLPPAERSRALHMAEADVRRLPVDPDLEKRFPPVLATGRMRLPLTYRQEDADPATPRGVRLTLPLVALNQVRPARLSWLVPGLLEAKITALIRSLPKDVRRGFVPAPTFASRIAESIATIDPDAADAPSLPEAVAAAMSRIHNEPVQAAWFDLSTLPADLVMQIQVVDDRGKVLQEGADLTALQQALADTVTAAIARPRPSGPGRQAPESYPWQGRNLTRWTIGTLPEKIEIDRGGVPLDAFPALMEKTRQVDVALFDTQDAAHEAMIGGLRRLCQHAVAPDLGPRIRALPDLAEISLHHAPLGERDQLLEDLAQRITQRAFLEGPADPWLVRDAEAFTDLLTRGHARLPEIAAETGRVVLAVLAARQRTVLRLESAQTQAHPTLAEALEDLQRQLIALSSPSFLARTPWTWLLCYPRYFTAMERRLEKLTSGHADRDSRLQQELAVFTRPWEAIQSHPVLRQHAEAALLRWMLEEYRVSLFAQELGTAIPVSDKRLDRQLKKVQRLIT